MKENEDAVRIYLVCRGQMIFAGGGMEGARPVDINHLAVWEAIDRYRVRNDVECFEKVLELSAHFIAEMNSEGEKDLMEQ